MVNVLLRYDCTGNQNLAIFCYSEAPIMKVSHDLFKKTEDYNSINHQLVIGLHFSVKQFRFLLQILVFCKSNFESKSIF